MLSYCGELVRTHDPDRFFMSLMMPPDRREALWALYAFYYEIAKTREVVTDTTLGLIRLQWWRDGIAEIYDGKDVRHNEVLPALAQAIHRYDLPRDLFESLCYAREFDLEDIIPSDREGMRNYAAFTHMPLMQLTLSILGEAAEENVVRAVSIGYAMAGLLKAVPYHALQQRCYLPADLLAQYNIAERDLYEFKAVSQLPEIVKVVCEDIVRYILPLKNTCKILNLHRKSSLMLCRQLKWYGYDVFDKRCEQKPAFYHLRLFLTR